MGCNSERTKRDWVRDNETEGRFEEVLDVFPYDEVLAELEAANTDKVGAPFRVPDCVIGWAA